MAKDTQPNSSSPEQPSESTASAAGTTENSSPVSGSETQPSQSQAPAEDSQATGSGTAESGQSESGGADEAKDGQADSSSQAEPGDSQSSAEPAAKASAGKNYKVTIVPQTDGGFTPDRRLITDIRVPAEGYTGPLTKEQLDAIKADRYLKVEKA